MPSVMAGTVSVEALDGGMVRARLARSYINRIHANRHDCFFDSGVSRNSTNLLDDFACVHPVLKFPVHRLTGLVEVSKAGTMHVPFHKDGPVIGLDSGCSRACCNARHFEGWAWRGARAGGCDAAGRGVWAGGKRPVLFGNVKLPGAPTHDREPPTHDAPRAECTARPRRSYRCLRRAGARPLRGHRWSLLCRHVRRLPRVRILV
ncbi:hypothetical protein DFJ74DRAFT_254718 [Hyaloraphidium curvatum]|nr:hypothetical protein DFJ74DRAFT_254718 [Hyaloraphidium curvatum]